jgi:hypothetical protein
MPVDNLALIDLTEMKVVVLSITNGKDEGNGMDESCMTVRTASLLQSITYVWPMDPFRNIVLGTFREVPWASLLELHLEVAFRRS